MTRVAILVEGQTESEFVERSLAKHLFDKGVYATQHNLQGSVNVAKLAQEIRHYCRSYDVVTTFVDFYGFRGKGDATVDQLQTEVQQELTRIMPGGASCVTFPYIQLHEFEALLFSDVGVFSDLVGVSNTVVKRLQAIRDSFDSPEEINDLQATSPSGRIKQLIPNYEKVVDGPILAEKITLTKIRQECTRFDQWLAYVEQL